MKYKTEIMKILVIGGTGLIGKQLVNKLSKAGHNVKAGSPSTGVDILTGKGLAAALQDTEVVIDVSNSPTPEDKVAINFFRKAGENLVAAEKAAGVKHHLILSIVGTDVAQYIGYMQAKNEQEDAIKQSGIPFTIVRATQFHEHITTLVGFGTKENEVHISTIDYQPVAAEDVVTYLAKAAQEAPINNTVEIAGPDRAPMPEFVKTYLKAKADNRTVAANDDNRYFVYTIPKAALVPAGSFIAGNLRFEDWAKH
jgi:uncharacterized protein YbjT (DUF2867 family)